MIKWSCTELRLLQGLKRYSRVFTSLDFSLNWWIFWEDYIRWGLDLKPGGLRLLHCIIWKPYVKIDFHSLFFWKYIPCLFVTYGFRVRNKEMCLHKTNIAHKFLFNNINIFLRKMVCCKCQNNNVWRIT